jgi:hypothetical protein
MGLVVCEKFTKKESKEFKQWAHPSVKEFA